MRDRNDAVQDAPPPYRTVVFDCDSTLSSIEGIEELGRAHRAEFARLTRAAMDGELPLEAVYGRRLELAAPTRAEVAAVGERYLATLLPNVRELVRALVALGKRVAIVSGGVLPAVAAVGRELGLEPEDVHAVDLRFDADGAYAGFDEASPLARAGGKPEVLARFPGPTALVGDGATDLEAAPRCARFVAFGGVERRAAVFERAVCRTETADFAALVPLLLAPDEVARLAEAGGHDRLIGASGVRL